MSRPYHSFAGYRRYMQMSRWEMFIFVESFDVDRYFYSMIANSLCQKEGITYQVVTAGELSGDTGGKQILLRFFDYLNTNSSLIDKFINKTTISVFFLDKDVDDYLGIKENSKHIIYTDTYEVENYLFMFGDLCQAVGASASLDIASVQTYISDYSRWRKHAASKWKEWVKLCLFSASHSVIPSCNSSCNYRLMSSPINQGCYGTLMINEYQKKLLNIQSNSGLSSNEFNRRLRRVSSYVDKLYTTEKYDSVFKGKWYAFFMLEDINMIAGPRGYKRTGLQGRLLSCLLSTLDFKDSWADIFRLSLQQLIKSAKGK